MCPLFGVRRWPLFGGSKCIGIMGRSNGGSATVRSRGGVCSMEGPSSEVLLYITQGSSFFFENEDCLGTCHLSRVAESEVCMYSLVHLALERREDLVMWHLLNHAPFLWGRGHILRHYHL